MTAQINYFLFLNRLGVDVLEKQAHVFLSVTKPQRKIKERGGGGGGLL